MLPKKRVFILIVIFLGLTSLTVMFANNPIYIVDPFFSLPLSVPEAPINKLLYMHYALSSHVIRTPVALDAKGRFYIVGRKNGKIRVIVLNPAGRIERIITPRLKDGRFLRLCFHISVSPSGECIWTIEDEVIPRVTVHGRNGRAKVSWLVNEHAINYYRIYAYAEDSAYIVQGDGGLFCLRFMIGQYKPQKFEMPISLFPIFFHNGKFWQIKDIDNLAQQFSKSGIKGQKLYSWVISWTPEEGARLVRRILVQSPTIKHIKWIDEQGNFYAYAYLPTYHPLSFLMEIDLIKRFLQAVGISDILRGRQVKSIQVFSSEGRLLDTIILPSIIRPKRGEELKYGQLIKADEKGIYLEVEKVNEPREYRIVRIVKKRRWQVWWDALRSWFNPAQIEGKER